LINHGEWEMLKRLEENKCHCYVQEGQEERLGKLQAGPLHLSLWEADEENPPGKHSKS